MLCGFGLDLSQAKLHGTVCALGRRLWNWGIVATGEVIGLIALRRRTPTMGTLSYILREATWGNGYATEAAQHVVFASTSAGLERLEAVHHPDNPASGRVLAKVGFTRTGTSDRPAEDGTVVAYQVRIADALSRAPSLRSCSRPPRTRLAGPGDFRSGHAVESRRPRPVWPAASYPHTAAATFTVQPGPRCSPAEADARRRPEQQLC
ncbi:GNAT family N-acetyltransferase [Streptomyces lydicus]|uniref:GNAT family N-acetyltransferase n=1 Tax=Streptomyces lydicus TaxID=47763 RepID=UPI00379FCD58